MHYRVENNNPKPSSIVHETINTKTSFKKSWNQNSWRVEPKPLETYLVENYVLYYFGCTSSFCCPFISLPSSFSKIPLTSLGFINNSPEIMPSCNVHGTVHRMWWSSVTALLNSRGNSSVTNLLGNGCNAILHLQHRNLGPSSLQVIRPLFVCFLLWILVRSLMCRLTLAFPWQGWVRSVSCKTQQKEKIRSRDIPKWQYHQEVHALGLWKHTKVAK